MSKLKQYTYSLAVALVALYVGAAGVAKMFGVPAVTQSFTTMGLPEGTSFLAGLCEIAAAVGFYIPPMRRLAAGCLIPVMLGAMYYHVTFTPLPQAIPALLILLTCLWIAIRPAQGNAD